MKTFLISRIKNIHVSLSILYKTHVIKHSLGCIKTLCPPYPFIYLYIYLNVYLLPPHPPNHFSIM